MRDVVFYAVKTKAGLLGMISDQMNKHTFFVYVLQSLTNPKETYVGRTSDIDRRLCEYNSGKNQSTISHRPWKLLTYTAFDSKEKADDFERYMKSGSGRAFRKRHFQ